MDTSRQEDIAEYTLLTLLQIRDYMAVLAFAADAARGEAVEAIHEDGQLMLDMPSIADVTGE